MNFDIVSLNTPYRGICRSLNADDLLMKNARTHYQESINYYFKYLDLMYNAKGVSYDYNTFNDLLMYYNKFRNYGVDCEMIAYDTFPMVNFFGRKIELIGIDVVHDFCESLLENTNEIHDAIKEHLNSFGLLQKPEDINIVLKNSFCGDYQWKPCFVYRVC